MPEGPSIRILKEEVMQFKGQKVLEVGGNRKLDLKRMKNKKVIDFKTFGKEFFICFKDFSARIHLLLFGTYRVNEHKKTSSRLSLFFKNGELNFYGCAVKFIEEPLDELYDWSADVLSDSWDPAAAKKKLKTKPDTLACDILLDQKIFAGVGNIIKNEVLYRIKVHPESKVGKMPAKAVNLLVKEARNYSFDFLEWKKNYVLKKHWLAHTKKTCKRCKMPLIKKHLGKTNRRSFFCENCQVKYI
jgi:endonuclease VIII